jgi:dephospho-CoA kinase
MTFLFGLTGSIGMGKSATAGMFRAQGVPVYDADAAVHALYSGEAVPLVEAAFPGTTRNGTVDRQKLSVAVLADRAALARLESIVHPLVGKARRTFLKDAVARNDPVVVFDVPLLFETGGEKRCDAVVVVTAPPDVQRARVLERSGMTVAKFEAILAKQMADTEKRARAHFLVDTSRGFDAAAVQVRDILRAVAGRTGTAAQRILSEP